MLTLRNRRRTEDVIQATETFPKVPAGGRNSCGMMAFSISYSASTSGSASLPSRWTERALVGTPPSESEFVRRLNKLDIHGGEAGSSQGTVSGKRKKRETRAATCDRSGRGLRQFSMKVCEKVESKGTTTYNEVADELVAEFAESNNNQASPDQQQYDEKNIRRRVYDALNVLMAIDIISKEKKEIQWKGLSRTSQNYIEELKIERAALNSRIDKKTSYLTEVENQTRPHATVEIEIAEDMQLVHIDFNSTPFELHDETFVLKEMRFSERTE